MRVRIMFALVFGILPWLGALPVPAQVPTSALLRQPDFVLVGLILSDMSPAVALIEEVATRTQRFYRVGDTVGTRRVARILADRVLLTSGDDQIELRLATGPGASASSSVMAAQPATAGPGLPRVEQDTLARLAASQGLAARVSKQSEDGVEIVSLGPQDLFAKLQIEPGDVIRSINGYPLGYKHSINQALSQVLASGEQHLRVHLERNGRASLQYYEIKR